VESGRRALWWDVALYGGSAVVALAVATGAAMLTHQIWGYAAAAGYAVAGGLGLGQLLAVRNGAAWLARLPARMAVCAVAWLGAAGLPLVLLVGGRAAGRASQVRGEVPVVEEAGARLLETGTPYLARTVIAALPPDERLHSYMPYQPGMALFGVPRALAGGTAWWSDARVWFAVVAVAALAAALVQRARSAGMLRALQLAAVAPPVTLAMATGGDDVPVLALCLLALSLAARHRYGAAGLAVGAAAALKLIAWPVAVVLAVHAIATRQYRLLWGAIGLPTLAVLIDPGGVVEHVVRFPLGDGVVNTTAQAPLPGYLLASYGGRPLAIGVLLLAGAAFAWWLRRYPPRTAAAAAMVSGYGLLAAMALLPASRPGYVLYPLALLAWAWLTREPARVPATVQQPVAGRALAVAEAG
jgi:hypothetical protein